MTNDWRDGWDTLMHPRLVNQRSYQPQSWGDFLQNYCSVITLAAATQTALDSWMCSTVLAGAERLTFLFFGGEILQSCGNKSIR